MLQPLIMKAFFDTETEKYPARLTDRIESTKTPPPFLVVHGDRDTLAPVEDARLFVEKLGERLRMLPSSTQSFAARSTRSTSSPHRAPQAMLERHPSFLERHARDEPRPAVEVQSSYTRAMGSVTSPPS